MNTYDLNKKYTWENICSHENLWEECVDIWGYEENDFEKTSFADRMNILLGCAKKSYIYNYVKSRDGNRADYHGEMLLNDGEKVLKLDEDAFISPGPDPKTYQAEATCDENYGYLITWPITNYDAEDAEDACDWDDFSVTVI